MPWDVFKVDDEFCVYRVNEEDERTGESLGCHPTKDEADAQQRALYANEPGASKAITKSEADGNHPASHYLIVEDPEKPTTWHLRVKDANGSVDHRLMGAAWAALHGGYRGNVYEGPGKQEAIRKLRALYEREEMDIPATKAIKMLGGNRIGSYAVLWGDENNKDLTGEFFTPETQALDVVFKEMGALPWFYHHAGDRTVGATPCAKVDVMGFDDVGVWYEAQLLKSNQYIGAIRKLIDEGKLYTSSGIPPASRKVATNGEIEHWPILELSGTPTPAEWRMTERPIEAIKGGYDELGLDFRAACKAIGLELPDEDAESEGAEEARQTAIRAGLGRLKLLELEYEKLSTD